ncbi:MAG: ChaN family lipoprotein [Desulfovibrionaceae bacterium]
MGLTRTLAGCVRLLCLICLLAGGCAAKAQPPATEADNAARPATGAQPANGTQPATGAPGRMIDPVEGALLLPGGAPLDDAAMAALAGNAGYVLIGEGHTSACDHMVQTRLIRVLSLANTAAQPPILGMEMVATDAQPVLDRFNAGSLALADLRDALDWDTAWRHDWNGYEPIFALSREPGMPPVYALNLPSRVVRDVVRKGIEGIDLADLRYLPSQVVLPAEEQIASLQTVFGQHMAMRAGHGNATRVHGNAEAAPATDAPADANGSAPAPDLQRFLEVQSLWDSAMAEQAALLRTRFGVPVIIIAGSGHVEAGWGIAHRLETFDPTGTSFAIMPWRGGKPPEPGMADAFFYCPEIHTSRLGFTLEFHSDRAVVLDVTPGSKAEAAGLAPGDVLRAAQGMAVDSLWTLHKAGVAARDAGGTLTLDVERNGAPLSLAIVVVDED